MKPMFDHYVLPEIQRIMNHDPNECTSGFSKYSAWENLNWKKRINGSHATVVPVFDTAGQAYVYGFKGYGQNRKYG
jgi:hypothetical protein